VSLNPLLVLICLDNKLTGLQAFNESKRFGVSLLSERQEHLSRLFAKKDSERPDCIFYEGKLGMPLIRDALAIMECDTAATYPGGDHTIFVGHVRTAEVLDDANPILYFRGKYRNLG